ncbi:MAG: glycosyltransferase family 2 protein [Mariniphaga sp.]
MYSKVSVIIPFYSKKIWLLEAVESVINQTYKNLEIIIVNDGSQEDISDLLVLYTSKIIIFNQENQGAAAARNKGIELSTGRYIAFLDSDDLWLPEKIGEQIRFMEENHFLWSHTNYTRFEDNSKKIVNVKCALEGSIIPKCLIWNPIATPCVIINKQVFESNSKLFFAHGMNVGEDSYLWQQLGEMLELGYFPKSLTKVRIHGRNTAFQAHLQLKYRGESLATAKKYKSKFNSKLLYYHYLVTLKYCAFLYQCLLYISKYLKLNDASFEIVCKVMYIFPFLNFKILKTLI